MKSKQQGFRTEKMKTVMAFGRPALAASVSNATGLMMFLGNGAVSAAEVQVQMQQWQRQHQ